MITNRATHMSTHHDIPLGQFFGEVFIFVGIFMTLHGILDILKASDALAIVLGLLIIGIGCVVYLLRQNSKYKW